MKYITQNNELKDEKIARDLRIAASNYENGEIIEVHDTLLEIIAALEDFIEMNQPI